MIWTLRKRVWISDPQDPGVVVQTHLPSLWCHGVPAAAPQGGEKTSPGIVWSAGAEGEHGRAEPGWEMKHHPQGHSLCCRTGAVEIPTLRGAALPSLDFSPFLGAMSMWKGLLWKRQAADQGTWTRFVPSLGERKKEMGVPRG